MAEQKCRECGHGNPAAALYCERCGKSVHAGDRDPLVGQTIASRFYIVERIGQGSAGTLYRAEHVTLRRRMAVKLLHKHLAQDDDAVERFRREAITVCEIDNDHIPQVHDFGRAEDGRLFFAMEFLEGEPLSQILSREGKLSFERCVDILSQIADGLMEAHTLGYVHRDLRPRSIFLSRRRGRQDFVKILDFGLAKLVQPEIDAQRTAMGMTYGDPRYMAPEQARGDTVDRRADIYSLGALGFEMLTGEPPFAGDGAFAILGKVLDAPVPRVRDRRPDCAAWLESVVRMALSKAPADRFQTVSQLLDALERKQVLQTQPPMPAMGKIAPSKAAIASSSALRPLPSTPITPISTSQPPSSSSADYAAPSSTQALPTVAPARPETEARAAAPASGTIRQTLAYPAVNFTPATVKPAAAKTAANDEMQLLGARTATAAPVAKAATSTPMAKPVAAVTPVAKAATSMAKPVVVASPAKSLSASLPAIKPALAAKPVAKPAVSIEPTTAKRADPTPRTVSALLEQEAMGWLEAADSITDQTPVQAAAPEPVVVPIAKPVAVSTPVIEPAPVAAAPAATPIKKAATPVAALKPTLGVLAARKSAVDSDATVPTPKLAAEDVTHPLPKSGESSPIAAGPFHDDGEGDTEIQPKIDAPLAGAKVPARSDASPPASADTPKDAAAAGWFDAAAAPAEESFADDDSYIIARPRVPRRMFIVGAAVVGVLLIGWLALRSPSRPPTPTVTPPPAADPSTVANAPTPPPSSEPAAPKDTPPAAVGSEAPQPLAVAGSPEEAKPAEPIQPKPAAKPIAEAVKPANKPPAEPAKAANKPVAEVAKPANKPTPEPAKPANKPVAEAAKPASKPVAEVAKPANKPVAEAAKPANKPVAEAAKLANKPAAEPAKPASKPIAEAAKPASKPAAEPAKPANKPAAVEPAKTPGGTKVAVAASPPPAKPGQAVPDLLKAPEFPKPTGTDENLGAKQQEAVALINLGKKKLEDGEPEAALQSFTKATELDPKNPSGFGGLGEAAFEQGDFEEAIRQLQKAIRLAPRRTWYQELLASAQFKLGRYKEAVETCKKVLKADPNSKRAKQTLEQAEKKL